MKRWAAAIAICACAAAQNRVAEERWSRLPTDRRIEAYGALVKAKPENAHYKLLLASAYLQKMRETTDFGYVDRAGKLVDAALERDHANPEALKLRTTIELERHHFSNAVEYSKSLIARSPNDPWSWGTLSDAYLEMGDYDAAADSIQKMVDLRPDLSSYNRAAHYRFLNNDAEGAIEIMQRAVRAGSSAPENVAWCLVELGNMYAKTGRAAEAEQSYRAALDLFPSYHSALGGLGRVQAAKGDRAAAIASFERAQSITPLPDYAAALYDLYGALGKRAQAERQRELIDVADRMTRAANEKANRNLSLILSDHGWMPERALELAEAELEYRQDVYTYDALAWALHANRRDREAELAMRKALALHTPEPAFREHARVIAGALPVRPAESAAGR